MSRKRWGRASILQEDWPCLSVRGAGEERRELTSLSLSQLPGILDPGPALILSSRPPYGAREAEARPGLVLSATKLPRDEKTGYTL